jgi:hypothetical protein
MAGGPVAGGALTSGLSWRAIFFLNLPAGLVAMALLARAPRSPLRAAPLDPAGQVTAVVALAALTVGVIDGGEAGFGRPAVLGCLLLAAAAMAGFAIAETLTGTGLGFAVPSVIVVLLDAIPADQAGMGAGLLNSSRQVGGTLAVAVFGALISHRASFLPGMRASLLIAVVVLAAASMAAFTLPGPRRENELTGLGG